MPKPRSLAVHLAILASAALAGAACWPDGVSSPDAQSSTEQPAADGVQAIVDAQQARESMPGKPLYAQHCASCHDGAVAKAPHRDMLGLMTAGAVLRALEAGVMQAQAAMLSPADRAALASHLGSTLQADVDALNNTDFQTDAVFGLWVAQDLAEPTQYAAFLLQGGLGMPDREYYLAQTPEMERLRAAYRAHAAEMFRLAGTPLPAARLDALLELERGIAESHATREESGDSRRGLNHWTRAELAARAPGLDWDAYFAAAGLANVQRWLAAVGTRPAVQRGRAGPKSDQPPRKNVPTKAATATACAAS